MTHSRIEEMLARRGELAPEEEERLQAHLAGCPRCRDTAAAFEQQTRLLRGLQPVDPPPGLRAGVLAGIRDIPPQPRRWALRPRLPSLPRSTVLLGPAAAALLLVGASALHDLNPAGSALNTAAPPVPTSAPSAKLPAVTGSSTGRRHTSPASKPTRAVAAHPARHAPAPKQALGVPVPTGVPVQSVPSIAMGPAPAAPAPISTAIPAPTRNTGAETSESPSPQPPKAGAARPAPTVPPPSKPPVVVAPARPTMVPVVLTPAPTTVVTIASAAPAVPVTAEPYASPTGTATAQP